MLRRWLRKALREIGHPMLQLPILQPPLGYMTWLQSAVSGNAKFTVKQFGSTHHHHEETAPDTARLAWFSAQLTSPFGEAWCEQQAGPGSALVHQFSVIWRRIFVFFSRIYSDEMPRTSQLLSSDKMQSTKKNNKTFKKKQKTIKQKKKKKQS